VNLVELDLSNNFLTSIPVAALGTLLNLKFLNLGANKIQVHYDYTVNQRQGTRIVKEEHNNDYLPSFCISLSSLCVAGRSFAYIYFPQGNV
jgi:hypothetical protein